MKDDTSTRTHDPSGQGPEDIARRLRESEERYRAFVTASSDIVYRMSPDWSQMRELDGQGLLADVQEPNGSWMVHYIHPDDRSLVQERIDQAISSRSMFDLEHRVLRADGTFGWIRSRAVPILDDRGEIVEWLGAGTDVTERKKIEETLREREGQLSLVFQTMPVGIAVIDRQGSTLRMNDDMRRFLPSGKIPSQDAERRDRWTGLASDGSIIEPNDYPGARAIRGEAVVPGTEMLYRQDDGSEIWTRVASVPMFDEQKAIVGAYVVVIDVDKSKRGELLLRESERHSRTLLAELQHRVRNTLAVVRSIARRTAEQARTTDEMISHFEGRLSAFSRVQSVVTRSPDTGVDLASLVQDELLAVSAREGLRLKIDGPKVCFRSRAAESVGLAIHELATNAVKYGALAAHDGRISVTWKRIGTDGNARLQFEWLENGLDYAPAPAYDGFGHELLKRTLPYELQAQTGIEFTDDGLRFTMTLPLNSDMIVEATDSD